jgi:glycosyltransferase involved in cell wall biosynthesis
MDTPSPRVTFVVPCYKLAHLLKECVDSILAQTYRDFEVLIMDDCSPDHTADVARAFDDPRVKHVRNEPNLGHLRNYNKGIQLATGAYIWLISADDCLRSTQVLARYVEVMDAHPRIGFSFCRGIGLRDHEETDVIQWASLEGADGILNGRTFLHRLIESNCVLAPSALVRKECYERVSMFPLDLPYAGDWFLWCAFALEYDVAYFADPMIYYREHPQSMTTTLVAEDIRRLSLDDLAVRWRMKARIAAAGRRELTRHCTRFIVDYYTQALASKKWRGAKFRMSLAEFEQSLAANAGDESERDGMRAEVLAGVGAELYWDEDLETDLTLYRLAIKYGPFRPKLWLKYAVLRLGPLGVVTMRSISALRAFARGPLARGE